MPIIVKKTEISFDRLSEGNIVSTFADTRNIGEISTDISDFSITSGDCENLEDPLWVYPIDIVESRGIVEERGSEEVLVLLENLALCQEEREEGIWEESCLLLFNRFLGFSVDGYEDEIFNMMNNICEKRSTVKGKGVQGTTKFDRERKKLE